MDLLLKAYVDRQSELLKKEYEAEARVHEDMLSRCSKQQLQRAGLALLGMKCVEMRTTLGGRMSIQFEKCDAKDLPATAMRPGDLVIVQEGDFNGIVHRMASKSITVLFDDDPEIDEQAIVRIIKCSNPIVFDRMKAALSQISIHHKILPHLFAGNPAEQKCESDIEDLCDGTGSLSLLAKSQSLNESQLKAIKMALNSPKAVSIIHGPPGTGKTRTLCALIHEYAKTSAKKILICGPSNLSVDNMVERLTCPVVRIGHPARLSETVLSHCLDRLVLGDGTGLVLQDMRREIAKLARNRQWREARALRKELAAREEKRVRQVLAECKIIACTLSMASSKLLHGIQFDLAIIDEAAQALQAETWIAANRASRIVLAGDHYQLPPTVMSDESELKKSLFELLIGKCPTVMLNVQYRMNAQICGWSSRRFYQSSLQSFYPEQQADGLYPIMFIDTVDTGMWEDGDESKWNAHEAALVLKHLQHLQGNNYIQSIAVITPYSAQVDLIKSLMPLQQTTVTVGTVDGMQGREADAVVISLVRSNANNELGFLKDARRLNVALTRARLHLCIIGDGGCIASEFSELVDYLYEHQVEYP